MVKRGGSKKKRRDGGAMEEQGRGKEEGDYMSIWWQSIDVRDEIKREKPGMWRDHAAW